MRILLIQPPIEDFYTTPIRFYPLGLLYVASVLETFGHQLELLDCLTPFQKTKQKVPDEFDHLKPFLNSNPYFFKQYYLFGISNNQILDRIKKENPDLIGISSNFTAYYKNVDEVVKSIKSNFTVPIFIGGNHATVFAEKIKQRTPEIDFVLEGPAETALPELLSTFQNEKNSNSIDWQKFFPAHNLLDGNEYKIGKQNYVSIIASRGCPYQCDFCSVYKVFGRKINYRDITHVLKEMRWNYHNKNVRIFNFEDDNLTFNRKWFLEFLKAIIQDFSLKNIELTAMNGICYPTLDKEVLIKMKQAGFKRLNLSYVTKSIPLRDNLNRPKSCSDDQIRFEKIIKHAQQIGFLVTVYIIIGLPNQAYHEIKESINYLLNLGVLVGPSVFYLPPGSKMIEKMKIKSEIINNWNLYRSSAFAVETENLSREQLIELFCYTREVNLKHKTDS